MNAKPNPGNTDPEWRWQCLARWLCAQDTGDGAYVREFIERWAKRHGADSAERLRGYCRAAWRAT